MILIFCWPSRACHYFTNEPMVLKRICTYSTHTYVCLCVCGMYIVAWHTAHIWSTSGTFSVCPRGQELDCSIHILFDVTWTKWKYNSYVIYVYTLANDRTTKCIFFFRFSFRLQNVHRTYNDLPRGSNSKGVNYTHQDLTVQFSCGNCRFSVVFLFVDCSLSKNILIYMRRFNQLLELSATIKLKIYVWIFQGLKSLRQKYLMNYSIFISDIMKGAKILSTIFYPIIY